MAAFFDVVGSADDQNYWATYTYDQEENAMKGETGQPAFDGLLKIFVRKHSTGPQNAAANGQIDKANIEKPAAGHWIKVVIKAETSHAQIQERIDQHP